MENVEGEGVACPPQLLLLQTHIDGIVCTNVSAHAHISINIYIYKPQIVIPNAFVSLPNFGWLTDLMLVFTVKSKQLLGTFF